jgi:polyribonucleotide nucleotidyltransferase
MFNIHQRSIEWGGTTLSLETGLIARQADAAVMVRYGETSVFCTAVTSKKARSDIDFLPLRIDYEEKSYAAGKIPGGFFKREGRPSETSTLNARLIDRPIRPLFPSGFYHETHVIAIVMSHDLEHDPAVPAIIGASAVLKLSGIPFQGPIGAARVGYKDGNFVLNPSCSDIIDEQNQLDLIIAGTEEGVLMVESEAYELPEDIMLDAVRFGHEAFQPVISMINDLASVAGKEPWPLPEPHPDAKSLYELIETKNQDNFKDAYAITDKQQRVQALSEIRDKILVDIPEEQNSLASSAIKKLEKNIVRKAILSTGKRIDGRTTTDIRAIDCRTGVLPRTHGSALFTRGETQALVVTTLGTKQDEQIIDALDGESRQTFLLHYNFPPFSVGEAGMLRSPGRREIGHGKLAWRAIRPLLPEHESFPYTLRVVSEITESNGSSSMATVCGTSMSLMDAGVPLSRPCAGIAMGLIKDDDKVAVLSDILGDEDHLGDMDFKVAGTKEGVTSLQMDIKITSITADIMAQALSQAKDARLSILEHMNKAIDTGKNSISDHAPKIATMTIAKEKIRDVIGPGGRIIREIIEITGARVDINDDGIVSIASSDQNALDAAMKRIHDITAEVVVGTIYHGKVVRITDFGAFVNLFGTTDGLLHISEISHERCNKVTDYLNEDDRVYVKCLAIDERKRVRLSMKSIDQNTGQEIE